MTDPFFTTSIESQNGRNCTCVNQTTYLFLLRVKHDTSVLFFQNIVQDHVGKQPLALAEKVLDQHVRTAPASKSSKLSSNRTMSESWYKHLAILMRCFWAWVSDRSAMSDWSPSERLIISLMRPDTLTTLAYLSSSLWQCKH